jgi:hypothetical protein
MSIFGDAWRWAKKAVGTVTGGADDAFSAEQATAYQPDKEKFEYDNLGGSNSATGWQTYQLRERQRWADQDKQRQQAQAAGYDTSGKAWEAGAQGSYQDQSAARGGQQGAYSRLMGMADRGPGPSAAEAQLRSGRDANMAQALALARSGRGAGGNASAQRQAQFGNAQQAQQTNQQAAILRAQEENAWRQHQAGLVNAAGGLATQQRGQDLGAAQTQGQMALGMGSLGGQAEQRGLGYSQQGMAYEGMNQQLQANQLQAMMEYEKLKSANEMAARGLNVQSDQLQDSRVLGLGGGLAGGLMMMSDRDAKTDVKGSSPTDFRPAKGYSYEYKPEYQDPQKAPPGEQFGPMAGDLEHIPGVVEQDPQTGMKQVNTGRLALALTPAVSQLQSELDALRAGRGASGGSGTQLSDERAKDLKIRVTELQNENAGLRRRMEPGAIPPENRSGAFGPPAMPGMIPRSQPQQPEAPRNTQPIGPPISADMYWQKLREIRERQAAGKA